MESTILLKKFKMEEKEFVTAEELEKYCHEFGFDHTNLVRYYVRRGYFVRIFKGIFHVRYPDDIREGRFRYTNHELVAHGMKLKGINNWYFGLHTALKFNNMTHEYFAIDEVINDALTRPTPIMINHHKIKFLKISNTLIDFGINTNGIVRYSDSEKTILDFIYIWKSHGIPDKKILSDIAEWSENISNMTLKKYSEHYSKSVKKIVSEILK